MVTRLWSFFQTDTCTGGQNPWRLVEWVDAFECFERYACLEFGVVASPFFFDFNE